MKVDDYPQPIVEPKPSSLEEEDFPGIRSFMGAQLLEQLRQGIHKSEPEPTYVCSAPDCSERSLSVGRTFECLDCGRDFCVRHIEVEDQPDGSAIYRCLGCIVKYEELRTREAA